MESSTLIDTASGRLYFGCNRVLYLGPDSAATVHAHHAVQICIGLSGPARLGTGSGARCRSYAGAVIPSDQSHETDVPVALIASLWLDADGPAARRLASPLADPRIVPIDRSKLRDIVPRLLDCWRECYDAERAATLMDEVVEVLAPGQSWHPRIDRRVARAREILESAPRRRISLAEVATSVALSPSRLAHLFSAQIGIPARRYLLWLRLRDAIEELARGASLAESAYAAGFADGPHLCRTFRRMIGVTPSALLRASRFVQDAVASPG